MVWRRWGLGVVVAAAVWMGCTRSGGAPSSAEAPAAGALDVTAQPAAAGPVDHSPDTGASLMAGRTLDARVLVITADGTDPALGAVTAALTRLGTPFDVRDATHQPALTADELATGSHGHYQAVVLDRGSLLAGTSPAASAFSADEWRVLATYEATFGVRRAALYTSPDPGYGFAAADVATSTDPVAAHCTPEGAAIFAGANCAGPIAIVNAFVYAASPADADTVPLLRDDAGRVLAATRRYGDGREALVLTFSQADGAAHTMQLLYGVIRWATRGRFLGERHVYFGPQIDDLFLASRIFGGQTYRITDADLQAFYDWQTSRRQRPTTAGLRFAFALNAAGAKDGDALTAKARAIGDGFAWINHTWDHRDLAAIDYDDAYAEFERNDQRVAELGLEPYSTTAAVTPDVSGLTNMVALTAARDTGIRYLVSDTSHPGYDNPRFNEGITNPLVPDILMLPRRPTNLYFSVSTPSEWVAEFNFLRSAQLGGDLSYDDILDRESGILLGYLLRGDVDPLMFHQANTRDNGGGHSLLSDLVDHTLAKYDALLTVPVLSLTMVQLAARMAARMSYDAAAASATLGADGTITLHVASGPATVPVTGLCVPHAEQYAGDWIAYVDVTPGADVSVTPGGCDSGPDSGPDGGRPSSLDAGTIGALRAAGDGGGADAALDGGAPPQPPPADGGCGCSAGGALLASPISICISFLLALLIAHRRVTRR